MKKHKSVFASLPVNAIERILDNPHLGSEFNYEKEMADLYRRFVEESNVLKNDPDNLVHAVLGLTGEAGEVADLYKKHLYKKIPLDKEKMLDELGDVRWYLELLCILLETDLIELQERNVAKLIKRRAKK